MSRAIAIVALAALLAGALVAAADSLRTDVVLTTTDRVRVHGTYVATPGAVGRGLILLHQMRHERSDWKAFAEQARAAGFHSLAIDLRGHGRSTQTADGRALSLASFRNADFAAMINDVEAAAKYLRERPDVDHARLYLVGASIGANLALAFAAAHPDVVKGVVLLSPGLDYRGVATEPAVSKYPGRMLLYSSQGDEYSYQSVQRLAQLAGAARGMARYYSGDGHGTDLMLTHAEMSAAIVAWLKALP